MNEWMDDLFDTDAVPQEVRDRVKLGLSEWFANIISYGIEDPDAAHIEFRMTVSPEKIEVVVEDNGTAFDPLNAPEPVLITNIEAAKIGGFGISLMKEAANEISYRRDNGLNHMKLVFLPR